MRTDDAMMVTLSTVEDVGMGLGGFPVVKLCETKFRDLNKGKEAK